MSIYEFFWPYRNKIQNMKRNQFVSNVYILCCRDVSVSIV